MIGTEWSTSHSNEHRIVKTHCITLLTTTPIWTAHVSLTCLSFLVCVTVHTMLWNDSFAIFIVCFCFCATTVAFHRNCCSLFAHNYSHGTPRELELWAQCHRPVHLARCRVHCWWFVRPEHVCDPCSTHIGLIASDLSSFTLTGSLPTLLWSLEQFTSLYFFLSFLICLHYSKLVGNSGVTGSIPLAIGDTNTLQIL